MERDGIFPGYSVACSAVLFPKYHTSGLVWGKMDRSTRLLDDI